MSAGPRPADLAHASCACGPKKPTGACPVCLSWATLGQRLGARIATAAAPQPPLVWPRRERVAEGAST